MSHLLHPFVLLILFFKLSIALSDTHVLGSLIALVLKELVSKIIEILLLSCF